jgi:hypothetical protein
MRELIMDYGSKFEPTDSMKTALGMAVSRNTSKYLASRLSWEMYPIHRQTESWKGL